MEGISPLSNYNAALFFGALTIAFHSWANFNRPSDGAWDGLGDLVSLLNPSDVRARQVVNRAFFLYLSILLLIYFVLCSYAQLLAPFLGEQFASLVEEASRTVGAEEIPKAGFDPEFLTRPVVEEDKSPSVPLTISLAMVGLAPQVRVLRELESRLRLVAHWMSGIPTRLIRGADALSRQSMDIHDAVEASHGSERTDTAEDNRFLIGPRDWKRYNHYLDFMAKQSIPIDTYDLKNYLGIIITFNSWLLNDRLDVVRRDNWAAKDVETAVQADVDGFLASMDRLMLFEGTGDARRASVVDLSPGAWKAAEVSAAKTARMISMLAFLLDEHGALDTDAYIDPNTYNNTRRSHMRKQIDVLRERLDSAQSYADWSELTFALWGRSLVVIILAAALSGAVAALLNLQAQQDTIAIWRSVSAYTQNAIVIYALPLLAALLMRQSSMRSGQWQNVFVTSWVKGTFQLGEVWIATAFIALFCVLAQDFAIVMAKHGVELVASRAGDVVLNSLFYNGPPALVGPTLAVGVLLLVDAWESGRRGADGSVPSNGVIRFRMFRAVFYTLIGLALVAFIGKLSGSLYVRPEGQKMSDFLTRLLIPLETTETASAWEITRDFFSDIWVFAAYASVTATFIGLAVSVIVWASLQIDYHNLVYRDSDEPDAQGGDILAEEGAGQDGGREPEQGAA